MGLPIHVLNEPIVTAGDMSGNITSLITNIDELVSYSVQAVFTGAPVGSIELQGSNDIETSSATPPTNWTSITDSTTAVTEAGSYLVNVEFPAYSWVRLVYTFTSGTGVLNARINAKRR